MIAERHWSNFHEPFLERAADVADAGASRRALGAFLTMRLVDQLAADRPPPDSEAFTYQQRATESFLAELAGGEVDVNHMLGIVAVCRTAAEQRDARTLWPPLLAFAYWLEQEFRLAEAIDVVDTTLTLADPVALEEGTAALLQRARLLRLVGRFSEALDTYAQAGKLAGQRRDRHSQFLSRIGSAYVFQKTGDLRRSERMLRAVLKEAHAASDCDAEARAAHDLAVCLHLGGRTADAVTLAYQAFDLYDDPARRLRALSDTAVLLKTLGHYQAAKHALLTVERSSPPAEVRSSVMLELLELSAAMQDRLSFERWRRELDGIWHGLPAAEQVNWHLSLGLGLAAFGFRREAEDRLRQAIAQAEALGLGERLFRAEEALAELQAEGHVAPELRVEPHPSPELKTTIERVEALEAAY